MAIIYPGMLCEFCREAISEECFKNNDFVASSAVDGGKHGVLIRFSDTAAHRACFLNWEYRAEFIGDYNAELAQRGGKRIWKMNENGDLILFDTTPRALKKLRKLGSMANTIKNRA